MSLAPSIVESIPMTSASFIQRHIGPRVNDIQTMLQCLGYTSLDALTQRVVPERILDLSPMNLPEGVSEESALAELREIASKNRVLKSWIGAGYYNAYQIGRAHV